MDMNDLTKEQVEKMSDNELISWHSVFNQQNQVIQIRKAILDFIEVRDAKQGPRILQIDSTVVDKPEGGGPVA